MNQQIGELESYPQDWKQPVTTTTQDNILPTPPETFCVEVRFEAGGRWWETSVTADEYCQILQTGTLQSRYIAEVKLFNYGTQGSYISVQPHEFEASAKYLIGD